MRVIRVSDLVSAARDFAGNCDGISYDNWDSIPIVDLDDAIAGCGISSDQVKPDPEPTEEKQVQTIPLTPPKRKAFRGGVCLAKG